MAFTDLIGDTLTASDYVVGIARKDGVVTSFGDSSREGRSAHAAIDAIGVTHGFSGPPLRNEEGTLEVTVNLVQSLNQKGATWKTPRLADVADGGDVDALSVSEDGKDVLRIQVVRAPADPGIWATSSRNEPKGITVNPDRAELECQLWDAIRKKANHIPPRQHEGLVLAINVLLTNGFVLGDFPQWFRNTHHSALSALGFASIWLVGRDPSLVHLLVEAKPQG